MENFIDIIKTRIIYSSYGTVSSIENVQYTLAILTILASAKLTHNNRFDNIILSRKYFIRPLRYYKL